MEKKYWKGLEELRNEPEFTRLRDNEFYELLPVGESGEKSSSTPRRDFLKYLGFGIAAASLAACEAPVKKAIPYLIKPEEITPGVANYYASTFFDGHDYAAILVKTREGRPIKIEANDQSGICASGTHARTQASVLGLYDSNRLKGPVANGKDANWETVDKEIKNSLEAIRTRSGKIRILSSTIISPTTKKAIADFTAKFPSARHIQYDAVSAYGMIKANQLCFGKSAIPTYNFDKADVIVAFECDFIGNWLSPAQYAAQYASTRKINSSKKNMSRHIQFEGNLSLTGSNADVRHKMRPSEHGAALLSLYNKIASKAGAIALSSAKTSLDDQLGAAADALWNNRGKAVLVSGSNDVNDQVLVNGINNMLGSYGSTIDLDRHSNLRQGNDQDVADLVKEIQAGEIAALFILNSNPVYSLPDGQALSNALSKVELSVSFADRADETASQCKYICPDHHYLESWNDYEPIRGSYSTSQPTIQPLFNTRQAQSSLLTWAGMPVTDYHEYLKANWASKVSGAAWMKLLQNGVFEDTPVTSQPVAFNPSALTDAASSVAARKTEGLDVVLYESTSLGNGSQANNPWLLELPDPVSRVCWDNYLAVSITFAQAMGLKQGNIAELKFGEKTLKGPVLIQPGLADQTVAVAVGFGRTAAGKAGNKIGINAFPLSVSKNSSIQYLLSGASLSKSTDDDYKLAGIQTHHTLMGRNKDILKETTLAEWQKDASAGNEIELISTYKGKLEPKKVDLWATPEKPGHDKPNHLWGMVIDLNSCIGCGSCVVACTAENNVPVVGKDEVMRSREMHWIRIDRYYSSDADPKEGELKKDYDKMEIPSDNPQVLFQPMLCQHCNHAPCETVCPVAATPHSSEGLNMMAYNRCVGTRYCENNCPYKVRRFNWFKYSDNDQFDYNMNDPLGKMVLNPDVVVRSRGVMEKCSLCVQRIQDGKLQAKKAGRRVKDGEIKTACAQACPTNAIVFGDYNDQNSRVAQMAKDERNFHVLENLNTQPNLWYQVKVRNV